jgi:hypothetical protein
LIYSNQPWWLKLLHLQNLQYLEARIPPIRASAFSDNGRLNRCSNSATRGQKCRENAVTLYRLIFLSHDHKITATTKVRCETDEQAIAEARNTADGRGVVILQDNRCVDAIEGSGS